jgi:hypothetical protein
VNIIASFFQIFGNSPSASFRVGLPKSVGRVAGGADEQCDERSFEGVVTPRGMEVLVTRVGVGDGWNDKSENRGNSAHGWLLGFAGWQRGALLGARFSASRVANNYSIEWTR